ncbi:unnamed protein product [Rotaria magnacalcarata]|uniref:Uncharacterized protein n=1 Tax=Rotaria magnacalcarata TaxID=392030 RepID=A0A816VYQ2_9BILA|nr:unnamed protein product [Rotaria magnacalcarata]
MEVFLGISFTKFSVYLSLDWSIGDESDFYLLYEEFNFLSNAQNRSFENFYENYLKNEINQYAIGPIETCEQFICSELRTAHVFLQAAIFMHARQLSVDPVIRYVVRRDFISCCTIKARPTTRTGVQAI